MFCNKRFSLNENNQELQMRTKLFWSFVLAGMLLFVNSAQSWAELSKGNALSQLSPVFQGEIVNYKSQSLTHQDKKSLALISYPVFGNEVIDSELAGWAKERLNTFVKGIAKIQDEKEFFYSMYVDYKISSAANRFVSIIFEIKTDTGNVDPDYGLITFTYDIKNGNKLNYADLFADSSNLPYFFSVYSQSYFLERLGNQCETLIKNSTDPQQFDFALFAVSETGVTLFFPPLRILSLPEVETVRISVNELKSYTPNAEVWVPKQIAPLRSSANPLTE